MSKKRRTFSPEFKAQVGLEALKGVEPVHVTAARHKVHPVQVSQWKKEVSERLPEVFGQKPAVDPAQAAGSMPVAGNEAAAETALAKAGEKLVADAVSRTLQVRQDYVEAFFARIEPLAAAGKLSDRELLDAIEEMAVNLPEVMGGKLPDDVAVIVEGLLGAGVASAIDANAKEPK